MTDIIDRLRGDEMMEDATPVIEDAVAEIVRLRKLVKRNATDWANAIGDAQRENIRLTADREGLLAEIENYRQTLVDNEAYCASLTAELAALKEAGRWVAVSERLPDPSETKKWSVVVTAYDPSKRYAVPAYVQFDSGKWVAITGGFINPTHWKPIDQPPAPESE